MTFQKKYAIEYEKANKIVQDRLNEVDVEAYVNSIIEAISHKFDEQVSTAYDVKTIINANRYYLEHKFYVSVMFNSDNIAVDSEAIIKTHFDSRILIDRIAKILTKELHDLGIDFKQNKRHFNKFSAKLKFGSNNNYDSWDVKTAGYPFR